MNCKLDVAPYRGSGLLQDDLQVKVELWKMLPKKVAVAVEI